MNLFPVNYQFIGTYKYGPRLNRLGCFYEDADEDGAVCIVPLHLKEEVFVAEREREPSASVLFYCAERLTSAIVGRDCGEDKSDQIRSCRAGKY